MSWDDVRDAFQAAIVKASGLPSGQIIWGFQNANAPKEAYISITMQPIKTLGQDWLAKLSVAAWVKSTVYNSGDSVLVGDARYQAVTGGTSASSGTGPSGTGTLIHDGSVVWSYRGTNQEIEARVTGFREVVFYMQFFTDTTADNTDASILAENTKSSMILESVRDIMANEGISPFDPGDVNYIPDVEGLQFRGRATCDVRAYVPAQAVSDFYGYIATVQGVVNATGGAHLNEDGTSKVIQFPLDITIEADE